jgi:hypothetical protein
METQSFVPGDTVKILDPRTKAVLNQGNIAASGNNWILVGAMKYQRLGPEKWLNTAVGVCQVEMVTKPKG